MSNLHRALSLTGSLQRRITQFISTAIFRRSLGSCGEATIFQGGVRIFDPKAVEVGDACYFWRDVAIKSERKGARLTIGDNVQLNRAVVLDVTGNLTIGNGSLISENVLIYTHDHGYDPRSEPKCTEKHIGERVWIGANSIILSTCSSVGYGSIIGAGSVVTKNVEPQTIVAGNPARVIKRLSREQDDK